MNRSCGGCAFWIKWKKSKDGKPSDGLCELKDGRCSSDFHCPSWKGKKHSRINVKEVE